MARRRPRGINYTPRPTADPRVEILVDERIEADPKPSGALQGSFRRIAHLGWRLYRARDRRKQAEKAEESLKSQIRALLPEGDIRGFMSRHGRAMKVLVAEVMGRRVRDPVAFLQYLGAHAPEVVKGVQIAPAILLDPEQLKRFQHLMLGAFGEEAIEYYDVLFDADALERKIKEEKLPDPPAGIFTFTTAHERVLADPIG